jgi:serine/threonine-protein kinase
MATGREPFRADNPYAVLQKIGSEAPKPARSINSQIPATLSRLIQCLLQKNPSDRFESAQSVQDILTQYLAHLQNQIEHPKPPLKGERDRDTFSYIFLTGLALACVVSVAAFWIWPLNRTLVGSAKSKPKTSRVVSAPRNSSSATGMPQWIGQIETNSSWDQQAASLRNAIQQAESVVPAASKPLTIDDFELSKAELKLRIEALENSLGQ